MKHLRYLLLLVIVITQSTHAQNWVFQLSNTDKNLWSVTFLDANTGLVAGEGGTILKTTDGGSTWQQKNSNTGNALGGIQFVTPNIGYAGGMDGPLLKTTDTGESWNIINFSNITQQKLGGGWFFNENNSVIALGNTNYDNSKILKTTNGGASWDTVYTPNGGWISYFYFPDSDTGYCTVSGGKVYKTIDGGSNWVTLDLGSDLWMSGIYFFDGNSGFVGGGSYEPMGGTLYKTINGGSDWQEVLNGFAIAKIFFCDSDNGYALAANDTTGSGIIIKTSNGGLDWSVFETPEDSLNGFHFINPNLGYAVSNKGIILKYSTGTGIINTNIMNSCFTLYQNYPNPFNPSTSITYQLESYSHVILKIYDILGHEIAVLVDEDKAPGSYSVEFSITKKHLSSGIYFYRLEVGNFSFVKKMIFLL
ncbi:MAG: T9SS type A sorting domain-containing protein [Bacteroidetes bacterium]|nr:T9SS type A sorting domain-containing protein [Bacteroidota bacterium]MBL7136892.1 T9SS type A sorting domain-containing protein [Candidatus Neomarinimicrobiota bacterium]